MILRNMRKNLHGHAYRTNQKSLKNKRGDKMHHYLRFYSYRGKRFAESWLQINLFRRAFCFARVVKEIRPEYFVGR
jgi:hypothetical protein